MKNIAILAFFLSCATVQATPNKSYYGDLLSIITVANTHDNELKTALHKVLESGHIKTDDADSIVQSCNGSPLCEEQIVFGYGNARRFLFGQFYLTKLNSSNYGIQEMYCDRIYQGEDFSKGKKPSPNVIPDHTVINVEHTWPQSKFSKKYPTDLQKSDLHHLFPTDSQMNSIRGHSLFGEVQIDDGKTNCSDSRFGTGSAGDVKVFEPPSNHKGHVARALFYFSIRYNLPISPEEEVVLKKWNQQYPVDAVEAARNEEIYNLQKNRNPFIDYPELAERISDF